MKPHKKATPQWVAGSVNWFDPHSKEGSIIGDDGIWYRIHEFSDIRSKKEGALKEKARVQFQLAIDSIHPIVQAVREITSERDPKKARAKPPKAKGLDT